MKSHWRYLPLSHDHTVTQAEAHEYFSLRGLVQISHQVLDTSTSTMMESQNISAGFPHILVQDMAVTLRRLSS
jgi:hypothetical protein